MSLFGSQWTIKCNYYYAVYTNSLMSIFGLQRTIKRKKISNDETLTKSMYALKHQQTHYTHKVG
jgi:hypothetical protein